MSSPQTRTFSLPRHRQVGTDLPPYESVARTPTLIKLNVGGTIFQTRFSTLQKYPESLLATIRDSAHFEDFIVELSPTEIFIDRDPELFKYILELYRNDSISVPGTVNRHALNAELKLFGFNKGLETYELDLVGFAGEEFDTNTWGGTVNKRVQIGIMSVNGFVVSDKVDKEYSKSAMEICANCLAFRFHGMFRICVETDHKAFCFRVVPESKSFMGIPMALARTLDHRSLWHDFVACFITFQLPFLTAFSVATEKESRLSYVDHTGEHRVRIMVTANSFLKRAGHHRRQEIINGKPSHYSSLSAIGINFSIN